MDNQNKVTDPEYLEEREYLASVIGKIDEIYFAGKEMKKKIYDRILEERGRIWEDYSRGAYNPAVDLQEVIQISQTEMRDTQLYDTVIRQTENLKSQRGSPYFARIDFREDGDAPERFYIGNFSLIDPKTSELYICDWRADVSSMFYDAELGRAHYHSPVGKIEGELFLRRQFKIEDAQLLYFFDSDVAIEDEILKEELGKSSDVKLKTIVTTIQKEQNGIIRDLSADLLLVQGCAGSGKTSIALHRLAYLLYRYRNSLSSVNVLIFSPNNVFNAYIADVLPALGEDRVVQKSVYDFLSGYFDDCRFETYVPYMERQLSSGKEEDIRYSEAFLQALEHAFYEKGQNSARFTDICFDGKVLLGKERFQALYCVDYANNTPVQRINKIKSIVLEDLENDCKELYLLKFADSLRKGDSGNQYTDGEIKTRSVQEWDRCKKSVGKSIENCFFINLYSIYAQTLSLFGVSFDERKAEYADLFPLAYLKLLQGEITPDRKISQVVIDEAQEYPPVFYRIVSRIFPHAKWTILGDSSQQTNGSGAVIRDIANYLPDKNGKYFELNRSYRSTAQINAYLQSISGETSEYLDRHGAQVDFINGSEVSIVSYLHRLRQDFKTVAVICLCEKDCAEVFREIRTEMDADFIHEDDSVCANRISVLPVYLAKGLEFDAVVVVKNRRFHEKANAKQYFVACSRALHKLAVWDGYFPLENT